MVVKRKYINGYKTSAANVASYKRSIAKKRRTNGAGYIRKTGFYGRYAPSGGELKFHDIDIDDAVIAINGTIQNTGSVNLIAQGTTESTRIGRKCTIKSINWRYNLSLTEEDGVANPAGSDSVRVILYQDKQCNGVTAAVTDILESDDWQSFRNLANSGRFLIYMDRVHNMNRIAGGGNGTASDWAGTRFNYSYYKKCSIPLEFNSTAGAITEIRSNNLGVLLLSQQGVVSTFGSKLRLRFSD